MYHSKYAFIFHTHLAAALLAAGTVFCSLNRTVPAQAMILEDFSESEAAAYNAAWEETESEPLVETEEAFEVPAGMLDGLKKDTPDGEVFQMKGSERSAFKEDLCLANAAQRIWERHENVSAICSLFDEASQSWKEYSTFYADQELYYSDDWTPGLEELRLLVYGGSSCVEDYMNSLRFVCFLNASGTPYRDPQTDPLTLESDTMDEALLRIHREDDVLYAVTQLTESSILRMGLDEPEEDAFYSCLYLLEADTLEVREIRISLHEPSGQAKDPYTVRDVRNISYSYDHGMSHFIETGCKRLMRHLNPTSEWEKKDLREVRVTLDPGTPEEQTVSLTVLKGDPVSFTLPEGYALYSDEALTLPWTDNGDYTSDLSLWAG